MTTTAEQQRVRALAVAEVARNAPQPSPEQLAAIAALPWPAVRAGQAAPGQEGDQAARGAA